MAKIDEIDGLRALVVLTGGWQDHYVEIMRKENLEALSVRVTGDDLGFLGQLRDMRGLVLNAPNVSELATLQDLTHLETLTLNTASRPRLDLDFTTFPRLRRLGLYWNQGFETLFGCHSLEELYMFNPPDADLKRFQTLTSLCRLELSGGRKLRETQGIERLTALTFLGLYFQSGLEALTGIGQVSTLQELAIESCKRLRGIDEISGLVSLKTLKLANCGEISSLKPLDNLRCLEQFFAWESTKIADGDLSVLMRLPHLREIAMMSRRGYKPTVHEVEIALAQRNQDPTVTLVG